MAKLFLQIINMSITSTYVILFVILIRFLLRKVPKVFTYGLWSVVLLRLTVPFSFECIFSLIPINTKTIPPEIIYSQTPQINSGINVIDRAVNNSLPAPTLAASVNPMQIWIGLGQTIWLIGLIVLIIYSLVTTIKLSRKLKSAIHISDNIYKTSNAKTPFVFGLIRPRIYLPIGLSESEKPYIIKHEQTHIKRYDHIIKFIAFVIVSIHWFNPLVWLAFYLMTEDMELSCDERVIKELGIEIKKDYSNSLLSLSTGRKIIGGSPIAFGENNTKGRIKNILNYKKPGFWITMIAIVVLVVAVVGLLSNPKQDIISAQDISIPKKNIEKFLKKKSELYEEQKAIVDSIYYPDNEIKLDEILKDIKVLLTEKAYNRLISNRYLIDKDLLEENYDKSEINDIEYELVSEDIKYTIYKVKYTERLYLKNVLKEEKTNTNEFTLEKIDNKWLISYLDSRVRPLKQYHFEPSVSIIEGTLITRLHYGPPGYGEDKENDEEEYPFILQLDSPIKVIADDTDTINSDISDVSEIQLVLRGESYVDMARQYKNKHIKVEGTLFSGFTGHHHTDVLIVVNKILD